MIYSTAREGLDTWLRLIALGIEILAVAILVAGALIATVIFVRFKSLNRALAVRYGLTPDQYRAKWGLPHDYPMVAPNYSKRRSEVAKYIGLGQPSQQKPKWRPARAESD